MSEEQQSDKPARAAMRVADLCHHLFQDIDLARLAPGQTYAVEDVARRLRAGPEDMLEAVHVVAKGGLLAVKDRTIVVAPVDRAYLLLRLDQRLELEQRIAAAAAERFSIIDRNAIAEPARLLNRSALVGDIDGYMMADRRLEKAIAAAADLPDDAEQLFRLKREFRRAWCAFNRLRDLNRPAQLRQALVDAVLAGDAPAARTAVMHFIDYLRQSY